MSLIDATNYATTTSLGNSEYALACLFQGCTGLYTHTVKALKLPATELTGYCYSQMFSGCTHLTVAPELPTGEDSADDLQEGCYKGMFVGCTSLTESPVLPATRLVSNCYASMFSGCSNLSSVICLATSGINPSSNTYNWLSDAGEDADSPTFYKNSNAGVGSGTSGKFWPTNNDSGIPEGWSVGNY